MYIKGREYKVRAAAYLPRRGHKWKQLVRNGREEIVEHAAHLPRPAHCQRDVRHFEVGRGGGGVHVEGLVRLGRPPDKLGHVGQPGELRAA